MGINTKTWRPRGCPTRYATMYELPPADEEDQQVEVIPKPITANASTGSKGKSLWCCGCMRHLIDPFSFSCGHTFCKSCIASTRDVLVRDFWDSVKDVRARMRCPVGNCKATIAALPLINGDFRFRERRPSKDLSKVAPRTPSTGGMMLSAEPTLSSICPPQSLGVDTSKDSTNPSPPRKSRRSDDLFSGLEDMKYWNLSLETIPGS